MDANSFEVPGALWRRIAPLLPPGNAPSRPGAGRAYRTASPSRAYSTGSARGVHGTRGPASSDPGRPATCGCSSGSFHIEAGSGARSRLALASPAPCRRRRSRRSLKGSDTRRKWSSTEYTTEQGQGGYSGALARLIRGGNAADRASAHVVHRIGGEHVTHEGVTESYQEHHPAAPAPPPRGDRPPLCLGPL